MSEFNPFSLAGKKILVTGASSGIGRGIAIACSKMGATMVIMGRNADRLASTLNEMPGEGHQVLICDLTDHDSIVSQVSELPRLDGVVHCAGVGDRVLCKLLTESSYDHIMDSNFKGPVLLQTELLSQKKISKGASVIFITSIAAWLPSVGNAVYSASKGALASYAKCLSLELAPRNIRVNCISPGMVWTDLIVQDGVDEDLLRKDESSYPLKRYGQPEDIANLAIYLLSDASTWMTGSNVKISGGVG